EENDSRCTKVGNFLRKTRIDELPQLVNVIKGDMSLVGPRPERRHFYEEFEEYINGFHHRLVVKPGITGLAQITGGYNLLPEEKIIYDMQYIEKMSFKLDAYCILMTLVVVFTHEGAR
ncbi:MAG: sugar transferase, partial [Erysipelotrichaceae bacterium]